jgi:hypothetical protein
VRARRLSAGTGPSAARSVANRRARGALGGTVGLLAGGILTTHAAGIGTAFAFIPVSIGALTGVTERDAGVAAGLVNTSQNFGAAIGVAVASSIAASYSHTLAHHGYATATALTGGFQRALWVCGLTGLAAIPVAFVLIRRTGKS